MTRTYSSFLLFEDVLDNMPDTSPVMTQAVQMLLSPMVKMIEEDCGTLLGEQVPSSLELEGLIEVSTGDPLTVARIDSLLSQGVYRFGIRNLHSCMSYKKGGICRKCYSSSFLGEVVPETGTNFSAAAMMIYQTDTLIGDGGRTRFQLTETSDDYYQIKVVSQGLVVDFSLYTLGYDYIEFNTAPAGDSTGVRTIHFLKQNTEPFQGYISKTYSGALLGMQPLPTLKPLLRESLYENVFSESFVGLLSNELAKMRLIPTTYIDYIEQVHSRLEKVLLILYLFALYSNVQA